WLTAGAAREHGELASPEIDGPDVARIEVGVFGAIAARAKAHRKVTEPGRLGIAGEMGSHVELGCPAPRREQGLLRCLVAGEDARAGKTGWGLDRLSFNRQR